MSRLARRLVPFLVATFIASAWFVPLSAQPIAARDGATMVGHVNDYRAAHGVSPVRVHSIVDRIAAERADQMADAQTMEHDMTYVRNRLAQEGVCWERFGEIIAVNGVSSVDERIERFVDQWYGSTKGHKELMLNSAYTHAGGSWSTGDGRHYAAMIFVKVCGASSGPSGSDPFTDIADSKFRKDIIWIANEDITYGCTETRYCPDGIVLRDQMATFLRRAMELSGASKNYFNDTWNNKHRDSINRAAEADLTYGCEAGRFCPSGRVTRAQMASFLSRALDLPAATRDYFGDDNVSRHEDAINRVAQAGITVGCDTNRYCPDGYVTRGQMAAFLHRAFN